MNATATLTALQNAEARLAGVIQQTARAVDAVGGNTQAALAQLAASLDRAKARLTEDLTVFAELMGEAFLSFDAAADLLSLPLSAPMTALPTVAQIPAPTSPAEAETGHGRFSPPTPLTSAQTKGEDMIDLRQPDAQEARQTTQAVETTLPPSAGKIAPEKQRQATEEAGKPAASASPVRNGTPTRARGKRRVGPD